ncbi:MAG: MFS transporter, partial [Chloroflexota bacterium]|nr:MFS transporter [Chloroflexota bacterium]
PERIKVLNMAGCGARGQKSQRGEKMELPVKEGSYVSHDIVTPPGAQAGSGHVDTTLGGKFQAGKAANYSVANFGASVVYGLFNTALPEYLKAYGIPAWLIGLLANERSFVGAFAQPFIGRMSDRTRTSLGRRRPFFLVGVPLMSLSLLALAFHPPFWLMLGVMTIGAFFLAVAMDPYISLMADLFPAEHRGRVGGLVGLTTALGVIVFSLMAAFLWSSNEALVFGIVIAILLVSFAYTFFTVKEPAMLPHAEEKKAERVSLSGRAAAYSQELRRYPEAGKYVAALSMFWLGTGGVVPFVTLFGVEVLGAKNGQEFFLPLAFVVVSAIFSIPAGLLSDRLGKKRVLTMGLIVYGLGAVVGSQSTDLVQATIALGIAGLGNAGTSSLNPLLTELIPRKRTAEFIGLGSAVWSFVQPVGSVAAGLVVGLSGLFVSPHDTYRWAFIFAGCMVLLAALLLQRVRPERAVQD